MTAAQPHRYNANNEYRKERAEYTRQAEAAKQENLVKKQAVIERLWLTYYNDTLFAKGLITEEQRNKMRIKIRNRPASRQR